MKAEKPNMHNSISSCGSRCKNTISANEGLFKVSVNEEFLSQFVSKNTYSLTDVGRSRTFLVSICVAAIVRGIRRKQKNS